jgi:hypothetical protein
MCVKTNFLVILHRDAGTRVQRGITCVIQFRNSRISNNALVGNNKRLLERTKPCWKQQKLVGNDKRLSERTKLCRKQQTLVGNNKRLLETTKHCWQIYNQLSISLRYAPCWNKNDKHMLVGLCRFFVVLLYKNGK